MTAALSLPAAAGVPLAGEYTVGGASPDFPDIASAVVSLNAEGISAPVTFRIRPGTYDEQVTISNFNRTGAADDEVIFSRVGPLSAKPVWQFSGANSGANNWVVRLDGADHVRFRNIEFEAAGTFPHGRMIFIQDTVDFLAIENCDFTGFVSTDDDAILVHQDFASDAEDLSVTGSTFSFGKSAITLNRATAGHPVITGNDFSGQTSTGINITSGFALVEDNSFADANTSDAAYFALSLRDINATIRNNSVDMDTGHRGINVFGVAGGVMSNVLIINNRVGIGSLSNADVGINVALSGVTLLHNSVWMERSDAPAVRLAEDVTDTTLRNNIFHHAGGGLAMSVDNGQIGTDPLLAISAADHNNYYSTSIFQTVSWDGQTYLSLTDFYEDSGVDRHSTRRETTFTDATPPGLDLHLAGASTTDVFLLAPALAEVTEDADGDLRGTATTFKGADEGTPIEPLDNADANNGTAYLVGGNMNDDYATPGEALDDLRFRGMKAPVTFRVRGGTYVFRRSINEIIRTGAPDDLLSILANNINNKPVFQNGTTNPDRNYVIQVDGEAHVRIAGIVFESTSAGEYGRLLHLTGEATDLTVDHCEFTGVTGQTDPAAALVRGDTAGQERLTFEANTFTDGSYGLYLAPPPFSGTTNDDTLVLGNTFTDQEVTAFFSDHGDITFEDNVISSAAAGAVGLYLRNEDKANFIGNQIHLAGAGSIGIWFDNYDGTFSPKSIVANNFITAGTGIGFTGNSGAWHVYHNTIRATDLALDYDVSGGSQELIDNLLVNSAGGTVLSVSEAADIELSDYNRFQTTGPTLVHWEGVNHATLGSYQGASGQDANSTTGAVTFADAAAGDLHLAGGSVGDATLSGTALGDVTDDIDDEARGSVPYVGADESDALPVPNDNPPVVTPGQSDSVSEGAPVSTVIMTLLATDPDPAPTLGGWTLTGGNTGGAFALDPASGELSVAAPLDRETLASYSLTVTVSDGTFTSAPETVDIDVLDSNDNPPVVTPGQGGTVSEDAAPGTSVLTVLATDPDLVTNFQGWSITGGNTGGAFAIDPSSGELTVAGGLDRETTAEYSLSVTVSDGVSTSAPETVAIGILDVNDNAPAITPGQGATVPEDATIGDKVLTVEATDADLDTEFQGWSIESGNAGGAFAIGAASGIITVAAALDFDVTPAYTLVLTVSDGTNISDKASVNIEVSDVSSGVDLAVSLDNGTDEVTAGGMTDYTLVVSNAGPDDATDADLSVLETASLVGFVWTCVAADPGASCTAAGSGALLDTVDLPAGAEITYALQATVAAPAGASTFLRAEIRPDTGVTENNSVDNRADDTDLVTSTGIFSDSFETP